MHYLPLLQSVVFVICNCFNFSCRARIRWNIARAEGALTTIQTTQSSQDDIHAHAERRAHAESRACHAQEIDAVSEEPEHHICRSPCSGVRMQTATIDDNRRRKCYHASQHDVRGLHGPLLEAPPRSGKKATRRVMGMSQRKDTKPRRSATRM